MYPVPLDPELKERTGEMRIYLKMIPRISEEIVKVLSRDGDIEVEDDKREDAAMDASAVLRNYVDMDRKISEMAKEESDKRGLGPKDYQRVREAVARDRDFKLGDDGIDFVIDQIMELFRGPHHQEEDIRHPEALPGRGRRAGQDGPRKTQEPRGRHA
jgi:hypothetical protein